MMGGIFRNLVLPAAFLGAGVAAFVWLMGRRPEPETRGVEDRTPKVEVARAEPAPPDVLAIEANGTVVPKREVTLAAEVEGRVIERTDACWAGRTVKAGDLLLRLDPRPLEIQLETFHAELAQVAADLDQLDIEIGNTEELVALAEQEVELRRREKIRVEQTIARGASSPSERDAADALVLTARQNLQRLQNDRRTFASRRARLEAQRRRIEAQLDQVAYDLQRTTIAAPLDGRIVEVRVERDSYARPGEPLVTIEDTATMEVRCSLRLEDLYWLAGGDDPLSLDGADPYEIPKARAVVSRTLEGQRATWEGVLSRFEGGGIDERTRTVPCRIEVPAPAGLRRGMFVSITLSGASSRVPLLSIPRAAFKPDNRVWLVTDDDRLEIRRVDVVRVLEDRVLIRGDGPGEPISPGARLVVSTLNAPESIEQVTVVDGSSPVGGPGGAVASSRAPAGVR